MRTENRVKPGDRQRVLVWLQKYSPGYKNARTRENILPYMGGMSDRYWRMIVSDPKKEGLVASSSSLGYWAVPANTRDSRELAAVIDSCQEMRAKALAMLTGLNSQIETFQRRLEANTKQYEFTQVEGCLARS